MTRTALRLLHSCCSAVQAIFPQCHLYRGASRTGFWSRTSKTGSLVTEEKLEGERERWEGWVTELRRMRFFRLHQISRLRRLHKTRLFTSAAVCARGETCDQLSTKVWKTMRVHFSMYSQPLTDSWQVWSFVLCFYIKSPLIILVILQNRTQHLNLKIVNVYNFFYSCSITIFNQQNGLQLWDVPKSPDFT